MANDTTRDMEFWGFGYRIGRAPGVGDCLMESGSLWVCMTRVTKPQIHGPAAVQNS